MSAPTKIELRVPATSANLGAGFDTFGLALKMHNRFVLDYPAEEYSCLCDGFVSEEMRDPSKNLLVRSYRQTCLNRNWAPQAFHLHSENNIPPNGGLGSSATAVVAGCILAHTLHSGAKEELRKQSNRAPNRVCISRQAVLEDAALIESHPDNIGAAIYGGFTIGTMCEGYPRICKNEVPDDLKTFIIYPQCHKVNTELSRKQLPETLPLADATYSLANAALFTAALLTGQYHLFFTAMLDKMHEPYRIDPRCQYAQLKRKFSREEFYGFAVSGSGPSVIILCSSISERMKDVAREHFEQLNIPCSLFCIDPDNTGVQVFYGGQPITLVD